MIDNKNEIDNLQRMFSECHFWTSEINDSALLQQVDNLVGLISKTEANFKRFSKEGFQKRYADIVAMFEELKKKVQIKKEVIPEKDISKKKTKIKGEQIALSFRGGARPGSGRKQLGIKKPVSVTLTAADWEDIDVLVKNHEFKSYADYFRQLHHNFMKKRK